MNKSQLLAGALVAAALSGPTFAADLPSRKTPAAVAPMLVNWNGFYAGVNLGGVWSKEQTATSSGIISSTTTPNIEASAALGATSAIASSGAGVLGGVQVGYNMMLSPSFLGGLEADIQATSLSSARQSATVAFLDAPPAAVGTNFTTAFSVRNRLTYLATFRGRLGWTPTDSLLLYATGGGALAGVESSIAIWQLGHTPGIGAFIDPPPSLTGGSSSNSRFGWTLGGGAEWMFARNWSVRAEYLYYDLRRVSFGAGALAHNTTGTSLPGLGVAGVGVSASTRIKGQIVRAGVNYHFDLGAPGAVVAKY